MSVEPCRCFAHRWSAVSGPVFVTFAGRNVFVLALMSIFFLVHRYDDHRRVRVAVRYLRPEVFWPIVILLWIVAVTVSQGSSAKFIYFDF